MFLETQFGADNITPIAMPKMPSKALFPPASPAAIKEEEGTPEASGDGDTELEALQKVELERLHGIGIPVPGVEIKVDKMVAKVWLEDLEVECANRVFGDRVRAVVDRAAEVTAPLWT